MRRILFALAVGGTALSIAAIAAAPSSRPVALPDSPPASPVDPEVERLLVDLNRRLWEEYMLHHNTEPYRTVALPEYLFLANIGLVETRDEVIATVGNLEIDRVTVSNEEFRLHGETAVLVGSLEVDGRVLGHPLPTTMRYLSVFVRSDGRWRVLAQSLTPVVDPRAMRPDP